MGDRLQEKGCVSSEEEQEMWPAWLTEGLDPTEIEDLMVAGSSEEEKAEPLDWDTLPEWLTEGLDPTEIEDLMAAVSSEEEKAEPLDWDILPEWLTEGLEETRWTVWGEEEVGQDLSQVEPERRTKQRERVLAQSRQFGSRKPATGEAARDKKRWGRTEIATKLAQFEQGYQEKPSQRQLASELGVPRTTLQHWLKRKGSIDAEPEVIAFFESPVGAAFLHRLVLGSHFVFTLMGPCGIRQVCRYLELTGLDQFVAASYSPHQKVSGAIEAAVNEFDQTERKRLGQAMRPKQITICEDETYHPEICLVAIEPVSNFILLEKYAENRQAKTWSQAIKETTSGLPVKIIQSGSDEGRGIVKHVRQDLGAHHSPDLFHVQHELVKGAGTALAGRTRQAAKALDKASEKRQRYQDKQAAYLKEKGRTECPPGLKKKIEQTRMAETEARKSLETASGQQERLQQAIGAISRAYHPYDLQSGAPRSAKLVSASLAEQFSEIEAVSTEAALSERCFKRIKKAKGVVPDMIATIAFFFMTVQAKVEALALPPDVEQAVYKQLIPGIYLHLVAHKVKSAEEKRELLHRSELLLAPLLARDGPLSCLEKEELDLIELVATECAQLFQRSSSCVEGRNGQLALFHHSLHRLSHRKLTALTTVHNYFITRPDGTTAAERFFGSKPMDLFEWVLERVDLPGRPAQKRSQPQQKTFLIQAAA